MSTDGLTDGQRNGREELIIAPRYFANAPKMKISTKNF